MNTESENTVTNKSELVKVTSENTVTNKSLLLKSEQENMVTKMLILISNVTKDRKYKTFAQGKHNDYS